MSPEQARGEELDARTDLFSFGAVLYEMPTGQQPFYGTTTAVIYDAILNRTPTPISGTNPQLPPKLEEIVNRLLEKDRDLRYQSAADLRSELKRLKRDTDSGRVVAPGVSPADAALGTQRAVAPRRRPLWLAASLALLAGLAAAWLLLHRPPPQPPVELTQKRLTFNSTDNPIDGAAISPDGNYVAYSDSAGIHVKLLSTGDERLIPKPAGVSAVTGWFVDSWFPDGTQLLAHTFEPGGHETLWTVSMLGQSPRELRDGAAGWEVSPDGTRIAFSPLEALGDTRELWVMGSSQGDDPQKVLTLGENESVFSVVWSPDGQRLAYVRWDHTSQRTSIETCNLKGANRTVVGPDSNWQAGLWWLPDGRIVYSQESHGTTDCNLWQIGVDGRAGTPIDKPKRITQGGESYLAGLRGSADGKRLTLQVYLGELAAGGTRMNPPRRLTTDEASDDPSAWTADSKAVLFTSDRDGTRGVFRQGIGEDTAEPVVTGPEGYGYPRLSRRKPDSLPGKSKDRGALHPCCPAEHSSNGWRAAPCAGDAE
jgi:Tol biopolymer transport system component